LIKDAYPAQLQRPTMKWIYVVHEFSLASLIYRAWRGADVYVLEIAGVLPFSNRALGAIVEVARRWLGVKQFAALHQDAETIAIQRFISDCNGWYAAAEPVVIRAIQPGNNRFENIYEHAARKQAAIHAYRLLGLVRCLAGLRGAGVADVALVGADPEVAAIARVTSLGVGDAQLFPWRGCRRIVNALLAALSLAAALSGVATRLRLAAGWRKPFRLGVDVFDNFERLVTLAESTVPDCSDGLLYVVRNERDLARFRARFRDAAATSARDGWLEPRRAWRCIGLAIRDTASILSACGSLPSSCYLQIAKLNLLRVQFEAFFNKYDVAAFLARDEYNADHIIRSQELRARGGRSLGLINGVNIAKWDVVFRFLDYDTTFVLSPGPFLKYNSDNWRRPDGVRQIGATALGREEIRDMVRNGKSNDIVCFAKPYCDGEEFLEGVYDIARAFPDRRIHVSVKPTSIRLGGQRAFDAKLAGRPANVVASQEKSFSLIKRCRYVVSGESSIISEAIHLGSVTFFLDTYAEQPHYVYREYAGLTYTQGREIADAIKRIERGEFRYPVERYADLADISGELSFDVIRRELGLAPLDPPLLAAMWSTRRDSASMAESAAR
jgi:hypothetical protein